MLFSRTDFWSLRTIYIKNGTGTRTCETRDRCFKRFLFWPLHYLILSWTLWHLIFYSWLLCFYFCILGLWCLTDTIRDLLIMLSFDRSLHIVYWYVHIWEYLIIGGISVPCFFSIFYPILVFFYFFNHIVGQLIYQDFRSTSNVIILAF